MNCPYCAAALPDGSRLCQSCGRLLAPSAPPSLSAAATGTSGAPGSGPAGAASSSGEYPTSANDPYHPLFDVRQLSPEQAASYRQHEFRATFSVLVALLVHFFTFGLASPFMLAQKFSFLPRIKPNDFTMAKAAGFLFIPFFNFYWIFVVCHRIVERLGLQAKLWGVPAPPSKGMATAVAALWLTSGLLGSIPLIGGIIAFTFYGALWPVFHGQIQATCNRLALTAAPEQIREPMLQLERLMRLRWIGWMLIGPSLFLMATVLGSQLGGPDASVGGEVVGAVFFGLVAAGGGVLLASGSRGTRELHFALSEVSPLTVAAYLRIDKNGAWTVLWVTLPAALVLLLVGTGALADPDVSTSAAEAWMALGASAALACFAAYAAYKALQLRGQISWLESVAADAPGYGVGSVPQ